MPPRKRRGVARMVALTPGAASMLEEGTPMFLSPRWQGLPTEFRVPATGSPWETHEGIRDLWRAWRRDLLARWREGRFAASLFGQCPFAVHGFERRIGETDLEACHRLGILATKAWYTGSGPDEGGIPVSPCRWHGSWTCGMERVRRLPRTEEVVATEDEHQRRSSARNHRLYVKRCVPRPGRCLGIAEPVRTLGIVGVIDAGRRGN